MHPVGDPADRTITITSTIDEDHRGERAARDQHPRRHRSRPAPLEHAALALRRDRDHEVHERRGDDPECADPGHVVGRVLDRVAVDVVVWLPNSEVSRTRKITGSTIVKKRLCGSRQMTSRS